MNILILNAILFTADNNTIPKVNTIKDCMIYNMALGFKNSGHEVTLVAAEEYKPVKEEYYDLEVLFFKSRLKKIFLPPVLPLPAGLWKYLRKNKNNFDLIVSSETFSFSSLAASMVSPGKTIIWQELADHNNKFRRIPSKIWYSVVAKLFMQKALVIGRSIPAKNFISKYMRRVSDTWIDHGINLEKLKYSAAKTPNFLIVSQLIARKNVGSMIAIFKRFLEKYPECKEFKLLIAGRGDEELQLKEMVTGNNLNNNIVFLGFLNHSELNKYIAESYATLFNTKKDLNIVSIPESIASGTPVITNMVSTLSSYINSNSLGIAKNNWNEDDLKHMIENNSHYVNKCMSIRSEMSKESAAKKMVDTFVAANK
jgi:1,2-diacylglycerol 3-alpha-glucosyltransferase